MSRARGLGRPVLLAWDPDLALRVLSSPLEPITDSTITSAAALDRVVRQARIDGYAVTVGEREDGASGLSAPVFSSTAELVGSLTISGPTIRMSLGRCEGWVDLLVEAAEEVTRLLGGRFPPPTKSWIDSPAQSTRSSTCASPATSVPPSHPGGGSGSVIGAVRRTRTESPARETSHRKPGFSVKAPVPLR